MNQLIIGKFISQKRKEKNLTQEQLAEKLGVSNKTVSKWECGKCMPDYSVVKPLCQELGILLIVMGIALLAFSQLLSGIDFRDFLFGLMAGISVGEMLVGVFIIGRSFAKQ